MSSSSLASIGNLYPRSLLIVSRSLNINSRKEKKKNSWPTANILKNSWQISKIPESSKVLVAPCLSSSTYKLTCVLCIVTDNNNNQSDFWLIHLSSPPTLCPPTLPLELCTTASLAFGRDTSERETYLFFSFCEITQYLMYWIEKEHFTLTTS